MQNKLNTEIKRLQKNARNKLYRLRKKGIANAVIGADAVPVLPLSAVNEMSRTEKMRYVRELKQFNDRKTKIKVDGNAGNGEYLLQRNGTALPAADIFAYRIAEARANIERAAIREQIELAREETYSELSAEDALEFSAYEIEPDQQAEFLDGGKSLNSRFQDLTPVYMREGFSSMEQLNNATQKAEAAIFHMNLKRNEARYDSWRAGIAARMRDNGYTEGAYAVETLTLEQLDWLRYYTDFAELTNVYLYEKDYNRGVVSAGEATLNAYESLVIDLVDQAHKIKSSYRI